MAKITLGDCDLAVMTRTMKGTRETRVNKKIAAMIAARREETTGMTVGVMTPTWSRPTILVNATSEMTTGEAIIEIHEETTSAEAPEAPEATGHPA